MRNILVNFAVGLAACGLALSPPGSLTASPARQALWLTVQACVADFKLIGSPFPCLLVDLNGGEERGYVILRDPPDTILAPTRKAAGIEDPWLQSREAPNYFDAAWRARPLLKGPDGRPPAPGDFALAVNSALTRSQDQFHIHLGCLAPRVRRSLAVLAPRLPVGVWTRVGLSIAGSSFWALRTGKEDGAGVEPIRLAAEAMGQMNLARMTILVAEVRIAESEESLILATYAGGSRSLGQASAESMLDPACSGASRVSGAN
ncbi:MAG TPA: CDP-diacylglycerol diphosphatase [Roseiarcus sp.]|nr:CDP-diacylglycerol diphosphatase [Roseiarcus sp.]